jgi:four helix bundle protein
MANAQSAGVGVRDYTELIIWQVARELADRLAVLTTGAALQREYKLVQQLRSSSNSVCANIAEGFGRFSPGEFARFLRIARGSAMEVQEHIRQLQAQQQISAVDAAELSLLCRRVLGGITPLIRYLDKTKSIRQ